MCRSLAVAGAGWRAEILLKPAVTVDWWPTAAAAVLFRILLCCTPPPEFKTSQIFIRSHGNCRLHPIFSLFKTIIKIKTFYPQALFYLPYQCVPLLGQLQDGKVDWVRSERHLESSRYETSWRFVDSLSSPSWGSPRSWAGGRRACGARTCPSASAWLLAGCAGPQGRRPPTPGRKYLEG